MDSVPGTRTKAKVPKHDAENICLANWLCQVGFQSRGLAGLVFNSLKINQPASTYPALATYVVGIGCRVYCTMAISGLMPVII